MATFTRLTVLSLFLVIFSSFAGINTEKDKEKNEKGNVIYSFASGLIKCQSQVDPSGKVVVSISSMKKNTSVRFVKLLISDSTETKKPEYCLVTCMSVKEEKPICAGWLDVQEVKIEIDPIQVEAITLGGKPVFTSDKVQVLMAET